MYAEIRKNGNFVARYDIEHAKQMHEMGKIDSPTLRAVAEYHAKQMFGEGDGLQEGVEVRPGGKYELHNAEGFMTSFTTREEAEAYGDDYAAKHAARKEKEPHGLKIVEAQ